MAGRDGAVHRVKEVGELAARSRQALPDSFGLDLEHARDLRRVEALDNHEEQHLAERGRQPLQRNLEALLGFGENVVFVGCVSVRDRQCAKPVRAKKVEHGPASPGPIPVASDGEQPRGDVFVMIEVVLVSREGQPSLLEEVLCNGRVPAEPGEETIETWIEPVIELVERAQFVATKVTSSIGGVFHTLITHER